MIKKGIILWMLFLAAVQFAGAVDRYRYTFETRADSHGTILLFIKYRVFYECRGEVTFLRQILSPGQASYRLDSIPRSGHMARTLGFSGRKLGIFTANTPGGDFLEQSSLIKEKILKNEPYYARFIDKTIYYPYDILSIPPRSNGFRRTLGGIQTHSRIRIPIAYSNPRIKIKTYFRVYDILSDSLEFYNHSVLPPGVQDPAELTEGRTWWSEPLDFTPLLNNTLIKAARIMDLILPFRQERSFRVQYRVGNRTGPTLYLKGTAAPGVSIWREYRIRSFLREMSYDLENRCPVRDHCEVIIRNEDGTGGFARATLERIDPGQKEQP